MGRNSCNLKNCRGAALVETALLLVPLLLIIGGLIDAGYVLKRSNAALMASQAAARAESVIGHNLVPGAPAPIECPLTRCSDSCNTTAFYTGHSVACQYLQNEIGSRFVPSEWEVALIPSPEIDPFIGWPPGARVQRTVKVTVRRDPTKRACLACFTNHFLQTGVFGESTYLLHQ